MSVSRAQREISSPEFSEWMAYALLEPFGPEREDYRAGVLAALTANINRDPKKKAEAFDVEDFFPRYGEADDNETETAPGLTESKLMAWVASMQEDDKRPAAELRPKR